MQNHLHIEKLTKHFGANIAVNELNLELESGQVCCLLGSNGAGKTTTFNLLLGKLKPDSGKVLLNGTPITGAHANAQEQLFYLPENVSLYPEFSGFENLQYLTALSSVQSTDEELEHALLSCGLAKDALHRQTRHYSKGMRQKTAIALALLKKSNLLLLDEPTSGLDPVATRDFVRLVKKLGEQGVMTLMITHDLGCAHQLADKITILHQGRQIKDLIGSDSFESLEKLYLESV